MVTPTGVMLAGGASTRLGRDKALLEAAGETLAARAARKLAAVCREVLAADAGRALVPGVPSLPDAAARGPAAGILAAARARPGHPLLVLACDLPDVPVELLSAVVAAAESEKSSGGKDRADWVVPRWSGRLEPLCALYYPKALAALARRAAVNRFALHELAEQAGLAVRYLEDLSRFGAPQALFFNLNTPEDLGRWLGG